MTYTEAIVFLSRSTDHERDSSFKYAEPEFNLAGFRGFLAALGNPERGRRYIHVAGTKGKGSTAALAASILETAGVTPGLYTSPHLERVEERIRVGLEPITPESFARLVAEVAGNLEGRLPTSETPRAAFPIPPIPPAPQSKIQNPKSKIAKISLPPPPFQGGAGGGSPSPKSEIRNPKSEIQNYRPTYFEFLTAMAFLHFRRVSLAAAVLEVGMGGRLDATNVIEPEVVVITNVSLDHTEHLGATVEAIAREKAGILKPGAPVVTAAAGEALQAIRGAAATLGTPVETAGRESRFSSVPAPEGGRVGSKVDLWTPARAYEGLFLPLAGRHQAENAALAVRACEIFCERAGVRLAQEAVHAGIRRTRWPGRLEVLGRDPWRVLDGAHNPAAADVLCAALKEYFSFRKLLLVLGIARDKDLAGFLRAMSFVPCAVFTCAYAHPRAREAGEIAALARRVLGPETAAFPDCAAAWEAAVAAAGPEDLVCGTGSLYLVGELRARFAGPDSPG